MATAPHTNSKTKTRFTLEIQHQAPRYPNVSYFLILSIHARNKSLQRLALQGQLTYPYTETLETKGVGDRDATRIAADQPGGNHFSILVPIDRGEEIAFDRVTRVE